MKSIAKLYVDYLERSVIGMVLASLILILISGFTYGERGRVQAILSLVTLGLIGAVAFDRRSVGRDHPEFKSKSFREFRLFWFMLKRKGLIISDAFRLNSRKQAVSRAVSGGITIIIVILAMWTLWSSFSISADIALKKNQAIAGARPGIQATFFDKAVVIDVQQISAGSGSPKVTAVISSDGYPDVRIEGEGVGYETIYNGPSPFRIRVLEIHGSTVKFFVERLRGSPHK